MRRAATFDPTAIKQARVWRCISKPFLGTILESGPSFYNEQRYSVRGEFGALYFSGARELCEQEHTDRSGEDGEPYAIVTFEVTLDKLVDLRNAETLADLGVQRADVTRPRTMTDAYKATQRIARAMYEERLCGLLVPSVYDPDGTRPDWYNLVVYPANIIRGSIRQLP